MKGKRRTQTYTGASKGKDIIKAFCNAKVLYLLQNVLTFCKKSLFISNICSNFAAKLGKYEFYAFTCSLSLLAVRRVEQGGGDSG